MKRLIFLTMILIPILSFKPIPKTISLFNGKDLKGWHVDVPAMDKDSSLKSPFIIRNGLLVCMGKPGGHLINDAIYQNYKLQVV